MSGGTLPLNVPRRPLLLKTAGRTGGVYFRGVPVPDLRLGVFIDAQNTYRGARESFFGEDEPHRYGQFHPVQLAQLIAPRGGPASERCLPEHIRIYTGRPDAAKEPRTYGAHRKQCAAWEHWGAAVIWRALRYPRDWPTSRPQEKGIDVALCIDFVAMAIDGAYDIGVIVSTDTDLIPALEFVQTRFAGQRHVAVATWRGLSTRRRLATQRQNIWCHWLHREDYDAVADLTDYNL